MAEGLNERSWSAFKIVGNISAAIIFVGGTIIGTIRYELAPVRAELAELKAKDLKHDEQLQKHDHQLAIVWKREQVNSACVNGLTGFVNTSFKKSYMSPYDLFTKPDGLDFDDIK